MSDLFRFILRLYLQRYRGQAAEDLLGSFEPGLRAHGHGHPASFPSEYRERLGVPWRWFAAVLHRRDPDSFWTLHRRWAWSRLSRLEHPVARRYEQNGLKFELDIRHKNPFEHYFGYFEFGLLQRLLELLRPEDAVFDIGANCGLFALPLARHVHQGRVLAFEPNPDMVQLIRSHARRNGLEGNLDVYPFGLGDEDAHMHLSIPDHNPGGASLVWEHANQDAIEVEIRDFRRFHREAGEPVAQMVKIDVEGFEPRVIEAMADFLSTHRPYLLLELSPTAYDVPTLLERLRSLGYDRIRHLRDDGGFERLPEVIRSQVNVLCEATDRR